MKNNERKDRSAAAGLGTTAGAAVVALATIGSLVGGGMAAGLSLLIGALVVAGGTAYGIAKAVKKRRTRKENQIVAERRPSPFYDNLKN